MAGINRTLYDTDSPQKMLTKKEIMDILHIKDEKVYYKLIKEEGFPFIKIGRNNLTPIDEFNKWIKNHLMRMA